MGCVHDTQIKSAGIDSTNDDTLQPLNDTEQYTKMIDDEKHTLMDLSIFNWDNNHTSKCIMDNKCDYLHRLATALKYYNLLDPSNNESSQHKFTAFCLDTYGVMLLDDIYHLQKTHSNELQVIKNEFIETYELSDCSIQNCKCTSRHTADIRGRRRVSHNHNNKHAQYAFYEEIMDTLHFNIFHLYEIGLRYSTVNIHETKSNDIDTDNTLKTMIDSIHDKMNKYGRRYCRALSVNSKYNIHVGYGVNLDKTESKQNNDKPKTLWKTAQNTMDKYLKNNEEKSAFNFDNDTWTDLMLQYLKIDGSDECINGLNMYLFKEEYDTESILQDIQDIQDTYEHNSNIIYLLNDTSIQYLTNFTQHAKLSASSFSTGICFWYWRYYNPDNIAKRHKIMNKLADNYMNDYGNYEQRDLYINTPKYGSFKEEIINSGHCTIIQFNEQIVLKSQKYILTDTAKKYTALVQCLQSKTRNSRAHKKNLMDEIEEGTPISRRNLQSVIVYCNMTKLSAAFSSTFRGVHFGESLSSIKLRNKNYYWLSKILRETVENYGLTGHSDDYVYYVRKRKQKTRGGRAYHVTSTIKRTVTTKDYEFGPFYCGMSTVLTIPSFNIRLRGPTSTSKSKEIAINFAKRDGILIKLNNKTALNNDKNRLHFFDCSWVSKYPEEDERLFFGSDWSLRLESVIVMETNNDYQLYFDSFFYLDIMISANDKQKGINSRTEYLKLCDIIEHRIGTEEKTHNIVLDNYISDTFNLFCQNRKVIIITLDSLYQCFGKDEIPLYNTFMYSISKNDNSDKHCNLFRPLLFKLFPNVTEIIIETTDQTGKGVYAISFASFRKLYSNIQSFKPSIKITFTAYHPEKSVKRSWLSQKMKTIQSELKNTEFSVSLGLSKHRKGNGFRRKDFVTIVKHKR